MPINAAEITSQISVAEATEYGAPLRYSVAYNVVVTLVGSGQTNLSEQELIFRAALLTPNQDFFLLTDSGGVSSMGILVKKTSSGTRVTNIATPNAQGGEYVNRRTMSFTVSGEFDVLNVARAVVSWRETVTIVGNGGPRKQWRFPINGPGILQVVSPFSLVRATQSGEAVGYQARPTKPSPLFPLYLVNDQTQTTVSSPKLMGIGKPYVDWPIAWSYVFERGDGPLVGLPNLPPGVV